MWPADVVCGYDLFVDLSGWLFFPFVPLRELTFRKKMCLMVFFKHNRSVAQLVEQRSPKPQVGGSIPSWPAIKMAWWCWVNSIRRFLFMASKQTSAQKVTKASANSMSLRDRFIWIVIALLFCGALFVSFHYASVGLPIKLLALIVLAGFSFFLASLTAKGRDMNVYLLATRNELFKVTWPNRSETTQTGVMVMVVALVTSLLLWGIDSLWLKIVSVVIGY
jgi:preprotein translocase subunit SecE